MSPSRLQSFSRKFFFVSLPLIFLGINHNAFGVESIYLGVPTPTFGLENSAPAFPADWPATEVTNFFYINASNPSSTDNISFGTPTTPRKTIPSRLGPGSIVFLEGTYNTNHESGLTLDGTEMEPIFIQGVDVNGPAKITEKWVVRGSYYVIENIEGDWNGSSGNGKLKISGRFGVVRNGRFHGDQLSVGVGSVNVSGSNMLIYGNEIYDSGFLNTTTDQDTHGTRVSQNSSNIWILNNTYHHNSGNGIQINAGSRAAQSTLHHVYVAGNRFYANRQSGAWTKQADHVIFSQNTSHDHVSQDGRGGGLGTQYAAANVWFIGNVIHDNVFGIVVASDSNLGYGENHFMVGNLIFNNNRSTNFNPRNPWAKAAISIWGGTNTHVVNNTMWNNSGGLYSPRGRGAITLQNNIIGVDSIGHGLNIEFPSVLGSVDNNLFVADPSFQLGNSELRSTAFDSAVGAVASIHAPDAGFTNESANDYRPSSDSPAVDSGSEPSVYTTFFQNYGLDIREDIDGNLRPDNSRWDIGAYEGSSGTRPVAPGDLH